MEGQDMIRIRAMTTRTVITRSGERVRFQPEALAGALQQVRERFVPVVVEHLTYLPPIGKWYDGEIVTETDGEQALILVGRALSLHTPTSADATLEDLIPAIELADAPDQMPVSLEMRMEPRNFDPTVYSELVELAPVPTHEEHRWSDLPPLEWIIAVPVTWGAAKFLGSFLEKVGEETATAVIAWIRKAARRAKDPERDSLLTWRFELPDDVRVHAIYPVSFTDEQSAEACKLAFERLGPVAQFVGAQREHGHISGLRQALVIYDGERWRLGWYATEEGVYQTRWFQQNTPEAARFLGRPLLDTEPTRIQDEGL